MLNPKKGVLKPWCILIIDSSLKWRAEIRSMLLNGSERYVSFIEAATADSGIKAVFGAPLHPDCIVLDYNLPEMDAPDVLAALAGPDGMPLCPVVVVTERASREESQRALRAGAQDYIGKDWTNPYALNRVVENACEKWVMERELRQQRDALRLVADRETLRAVFSDAARSLTDEESLKHIALQLLGQYLQASRVMYGEVGKSGAIIVGSSYVSGVQQMPGIYNLDDYGPTLLAKLLLGEQIVVSDWHGDGAYSDTEKVVYAQLEIAACLTTPILKNGQLVAILGVHQKTPRDWTPEDILIAREIAERTWTGVEQARYESMLHASQTQLAQMIEVMPSFCAVLRGPTHVFEMANQPYFDVTGHGPEILGKSLIEAMTEMVGQPFPALLDEVYQTGKPFHAQNMPARLPRGPGGSLIDVFFDFSYLPLREFNGEVSGILVHGLDRTEHFLAAESLSRQERELRSLADNTPDVLIRFDRQLHHIFVNLSIMTVTGRPVSDFIGKTSREAGMPENFCVQWERALNAVISTARQQSLEYSFETPLGLRHYFSLLVPEFNPKGEVESILGVTHDITDRRAYELRLLEQDVRKDQFLATLAHELRNPLAPIRSGLQLLKLSPTTEVAARTLTIMERQLGQLVRLIDDLLDVSRISTGKIVLRLERIAFQEVAAAALEASRPVIVAAGHSLVIDWPDQVVWLDADPTRLAQILSNLLTNSAKYMHSGGRIKFSAQQLGDRLVISVLDTGMGIPADMLGPVFEMFTQVNRTLDRAQGGLGIGLSLVKTLVEMHGGSVQAASAGINRGSEFTVTLPMISVLTDKPEPAARPITTTPARHRILVVDDNADAAETMAMLLELSGHETRTAFGGQEALDMALSFRPAVVFLDIGLPGMNGYKVARRLLADPATAESKLIALTGWGAEEDISNSKMAGFHAHLTKPVDPDTIDATIAQVLSAKKAK